MPADGISTAIEIQDFGTSPGGSRAQHYTDCRRARKVCAMSVAGPSRRAASWPPAVAFGALRTSTDFHRATICSDWPNCDI